MADTGIYLDIQPHVEPDPHYENIEKESKDKHVEVLGVLKIFRYFLIVIILICVLITAMCAYLVHSMSVPSEPQSNTGPLPGVTSCDDIRCLNGGVCIDDSRGYRCECADGYTGRVCETDINDCSNVTCVNGGVSRDGVTCVCPNKHRGKLCEKGGPDFESEWMIMISKSVNDSYIEVPHGLREVPLKVKVLVKPTSGPNAFFTFEASSQQEADDDRPEPYCGVIYFYDYQRVYIRAPMPSKDTIAGHIICTGHGWSDGYLDHDQITNQALVKVLAWKMASFPVPDLQTEWTHIGGNTTFVEIPHSLSVRPAYFHLQVRCGDHNSGILYGEGTGRGSPSAGNDQSGGVLYAISNDVIRVWIHSIIRYNLRGILLANDGYGPNANQFYCGSGEFRVYGWTELGTLRFQHTVEMTMEALQDPDILRKKTMISLPEQHETGFLTVQVMPLSGTSMGFTFPVIGQIQRSYQHHFKIYGGVAFGYSTSELRLFVPIAPRGALVVVDEVWGDGQYATSTKHARIDVRIWDF